MNASAQKGAELVRLGYNFICASCPHMQRSHDRGEESCGRFSCGFHKGLPEYAGPVSRDLWPHLCWICGEGAELGLHFVRVGMILGACDEHRDVHQQFLGESEAAGVIEITGRTNAIHQEK